MNKNVYFELKKIKDLPPSERQIVDFILTNPTEVISLGVVALGAITYTSSSTVIRLIKKLNYKSYTEFKSDLAIYLPKYRESIRNYNQPQKIEQSDSIEHLMNKMIFNSQAALNEVLNLNSVLTIVKCIKLIENSPRIDLYGSGVSNLICHDAKIKGLRLGLNITSHHFYTEMAMQAKISTNKDLAILVSYTGKTIEIIKIAKLLKQNNVKTISITSMTVNEVASLCDINLYVSKTESFYRVGGVESRISMQAILDIIFAGYLHENKQKEETISKTFTDDVLEIGWDK